MSKNKKKIKSAEDKRFQRKYQLIVAIICLIILTSITLIVYLFNHI